MRLLPEIPEARRWAVLALALALLACRGATSADASSTALPRYTVRAEVLKVPARPEGELVLRHEAIPNFADRTGAVVGMSAMVMPFPVSAGVSLEGIAPGDKVAITFSVDWGEGRYAIERLERLPRETALKVGSPHGVEAPEPHAAPGKTAR